MHKLEVKVPKRLFADPRRLTRAIENALTGAALGAQADFNVTTQTWKKRPTFLIITKPGMRIIFTTNLIYKFISGGTRVRYATMTKDFQAKTMHRTIASFKGAGGVAFISKKHPRPGIKAREFAQEIQKKWQTELPITLQRAIDAEF